MSQEPKSVEETEEDTGLFVVDPEDYQETKKLETIHQARRHVLSIREDYPGRTSSTEWEKYRNQLAAAVAQYGHELAPLLEEAGESGLVTEEDIELASLPCNVMEFIRYDGAVPNHEKETVDRPGVTQSMEVYRRLDALMRKLGLGLEIREDKGPAQI